MASRTASRAFLRSSFRPTTTTTTTHSARFILPTTQGLRATRGFASEAKPPPQGSQTPPGSGSSSAGKPPSSSSNGLLWAAVAIAGAGGYFYWKGTGSTVVPKDFKPTQQDYQKVYDAIAHKLADETDYDDGSYGPVCSLSPLPPPVYPDRYIGRQTS